MREINRKPNMVLEKNVPEKLSLSERWTSYEEVEKCYTEEEAEAEAERCLDCPAKYCMKKCPLHVPIPEFIEQIREKNYEAAYEIISKANPISAMTCRVCPQEKQCESECTRAIKGEAVSIGSLERFVTDYHWKCNGSKHQSSKKIDKKIAIVGSGPAGIACAASLAAAGCHVEIFEGQKKPGGVAGRQIPQFILPEEVMQSEFQQLLQHGVVLHTGSYQFDVVGLRSTFDAVFVATGANWAIDSSIPGEQLQGVMQANKYLEKTKKPQAKHVVVIGGGDTAIDVARVAKREGADTVKILYRRSSLEIPACNSDIEAATEEGIEILTLLSPKNFDGRAGKVTGAVMDKMKMTAPDYPAGRKNVEVSGECVTYETDLVILALGFQNMQIQGLPMDQDNKIVTGRDQVSTSVDGVYAGGDAVTGPSTVAKAAAAGLKAASQILEYLDVI